ncbi:elongation of very long chain fatty acids protein AAEL008004-like [Ixodes scapularis]|uniref:elongation of very long chain fatty acids protein AAEL008004-like n=1 Tax=Ixodes scapularis TaxID=6945 RepID=UPI001A9EFBB7|nr:elongation of very long chain fatty acids protein AAEL008004-like [Ixodes scapularis]XP_042148848.1 elongation of very long chain fatty acids protein AAEL008004-like [Ixodes scapularis]
MTSVTWQLIAGMHEKYQYAMSARDPRIAGWGLSADLSFVLPVSLGYLYVVKVAGPRWMRNRPPYDLKTVITLYNLCQVIANVFFCVQFFRHSYLGGGFSVLCQGMSYSRDQNSMTLLRLCWWYFFVRIADFMDTVFSVATKRFSQVTLLHVSHHFLVVLNGWVWFNFACGGQAMMALCANGIIHIIMYTYYFLCSFGPGVRPYLWWKKYLTGLQIFHIAFVGVHMTIPLFYDCGFPTGAILFSTPQWILALGMFTKFYVQAYTLKRRPEPRGSVARKGD